MTTMRERFYRLAADALEDDPRVAMVFADIGVAEMPRHPRLFNVGIREQLMIGVAAGLALEGMRPVAHSYAPFLVERPYEQIKLDLGHQDLGAVLVSTGASYDGSSSGRTHQAPEDVALLAALPGWTIEIPGHADELEAAFRRALGGDGRVYIRLTLESNAEPVHGDGLTVLRHGSDAAPLVVAVGPTLDETLAATWELDATVAYLSTVRPFARAGLRNALRGTDVDPRRAVSRRHLVRRRRARARRPPAPAARARRREPGAAPLRHAGRAPRCARPGRRRHPRRPGRVRNAAAESGVAARRPTRTATSRCQAPGRGSTEQRHGSTRRAVRNHAELAGRRIA